MKVDLSTRERQELKEIVKRSRAVRVVKRAQALLWLAEGESARSVARRLGVSHQTVYNWVAMFAKRRGEPMEGRLRDRPRSGRPPKKRQAVVEVIEEVMERDPREMGYASPVWTTPLLRHYCRRTKGVEVSGRTIRRALRGQGYRYKRPRYVLVRRSPSWRQAKGGSSGG